MKKIVCFTLVLVVCAPVWANRSEKLKNNIEKREAKLKREIARQKENSKSL